MAELGDPAHTLIGQTLNGRYRVISLIGTGGMSAVYRAEHVQLGKSVALKVLNAEMATHREAALRFEREVLVSGKIRHPHVVSATDSGRLADGSLYLVLEFVAGHSLRDLINDEGRLPVARALTLAAQIADALDAAHRMGVVHRDLKPSNVMLCEQEGHSEFVKVLDFGLASLQGTSAAGEGLTRAGSIFGTPEYMAPEQARGEEVDPRADLYALGVILYELLAGRQPFHAPEPVGVLIKHIQDAPPPLPREIPERVARFVLALLEKEPDRRPKNARLVSKTLSKLAAQPMSNSTAPPSRVAVARQPLLIAAALTLTAALAGAAAGWFARPRSASPERPVLSGTEEVQRTRTEGPKASAEPPAAAMPRKPDGSASLALGSGLITTGQGSRGLDALAAALDTEPALSENPELLSAVRRAVDDPLARDRALEFAANRLGPSAADLLFDVWTATSAKTPATRGARKWLDLAAVRAKARPAVLLALESRDARTCSKARALLPRLAEHGDERSLSQLKRFRATSGCGFLSLGDCYKCLRRDDALEKTIALLATREAPKFRSK